ncbi:hypothetical protein [Mycolicibacterium llatzerense]|uniref:hypothetical protein n=1 Tax=Mycolicibacterium llatzerense TaxID=280871 RepID=UPI0008DCD82A|nr:hypothetical protein [Mycolicibacterium llatzerense]
MAQFKVKDLVQLKDEYEVMGNASLFRIRSIANGKAVLGQLDTDSNRYLGVDTEIDIDDPQLIVPHREVLEMYSRHVR